VILFVLSVIAFLAGLVILSAANSALHEIEGFVLFVIAAVLLSGASIVDAIMVLPKRRTKQESAERQRLDVMEPEARHA
jgi:hypothetical protein